MNSVQLLAFLFCMSGVEPRYVLMDDMEMTQDTYNTFFSEEAAQRASVSVLGGFKLWDNNMTDGRWVIPYAFKSNMIERIQSKILDAIKDFEKVMCVRFVEATNEEEFLLFTNDGSCSAGVGRKSSREVNIAEGWCEGKGNIHHEMMHSLGFFHEHQRPDRDEYIRIHQENIRNGLDVNFRKMTYSSIDSHDIEYDFKSVLQYPSGAGSNRYGAMTMTKLDGSAITEFQRDFMSEGDIKQLNLLYRCSEAVCTDSINSTECEVNVRRGLCYSKSVQMFNQCRKSCGFCYCEDDEDCSRHSKHECYKSRSRVKMATKCPVMCGFCGKACFDASKRRCAAEMARKGGCHVREEQMAIACPKTCRYCTGVTSK